MIGKLNGMVDSIYEDHLIVDVHGVGYAVFCPARLLSECITGQPLQLIIETHVREDHILLYGFQDLEERECFRHLTSVQRVSPRMGLAILSTLPPASLTDALIRQDATQFTQISGIGKKLAERIIAELKDKTANMGGEHNFAPVSVVSTIPQKTSALHTDALSALTNLGYSRTEATTAIARIQAEQPDISLDQLIVSCLKELAH